MTEAEDSSQLPQGGAAWIDENPRHASFISSRPLPLRVPHRGRIYGFFWPILYGWRYGYRNPDEDLLGVVEAVGDTVRIQAVAAHAVLTGAARDEAGRILRRVNTELSEPLPDFATLLGLEARLYALYPEPVARSRKWILLERFHRVAAEGAARFRSRIARATDGSGESDAPAEDPGPDLQLATTRLQEADSALEAAKRGIVEAEAAAAAAGTDEERAAADQLIGEARQRLDLASAERETADAARNAAQRRVEVTSAQANVALARRELTERAIYLDGARTALAGTIAGSRERIEAERAFDAAVRDVAAAQSQLDDAGAALRRAESQSNAADASGGGGDGAASAPLAADPASPEPERIEEQALLSYIHTNYLMTTAREKAVRDLKRWILVKFVLFLIALMIGLIAATFILPRYDVGEYWGLLLGLALVASVGRAGATTSIIRRLQGAVSGNVLASDPIIGLTALRTGKNEISLALISSSIFALLLYAFFATGVPQQLGFQGGVFPEMRRDPPSPPQPERESGEVRGAAGEADSRRSDTGEQIPPKTSGEGTRSGSDYETAREIYIAERAKAHDAIARARHTSQPDHSSLRSIEAAIEAQGGVVATARRLSDVAQLSGNPEERQQSQGFLDREVAEAGRLMRLSDEQARAMTEEVSLICMPTKTCDPVPALATSLGLNGPMDFFKLLLWAFIAGFAERFVPDMLDRLVSRNKGSARRAEESALNSA